MGTESPGTPRTGTLSASRPLWAADERSRGSHEDPTTVRILGTGLHHNWHIASVAAWSAGGTRTSLVTTAVSDTELSAVIPAALLHTPVRALIRVSFSDVMEGTPEGGTNDAVLTVE